MSSGSNIEPCLFVYPYITNTPLLTRCSNRRGKIRERKKFWKWLVKHVQWLVMSCLGSDIERLKRRIETLVKSNDEKVRNRNISIPEEFVRCFRKEKSKIYKYNWLNVKPVYRCYQSKRTTIIVRRQIVSSPYWFLPWMKR